MKVSDVMTRDVVSVTPDTPYKELIDRLVECDVSGLPVVDTTGTLLGIVNRGRPDVEGGLRRSPAPGTRTVACHPTDDVRVAARRMLQHSVKRMPVVEGDELVGIVSRHDLLATFARPDDAIRSDVGTLLTTHPNRPEDAHVHFTVADGIVTLTGDVRHSWDRSILVTLVRDVPGVIKVVDHLHSREPDPPLPTPWTFGA